jgi:hypothetical protein
MVFHDDLVVIGSGLGDSAPELRAVENASKAGVMGSGGRRA